MKIIIRGRGGGKTKQAILQSSKTDQYILVRSRKEATEIFSMANDMGVGIPYPIALNDVGKSYIKGTSLERDGVIVDNALEMLQDLLAVPINMVTLTKEEDLND